MKRIALALVILICVLGNTLLWPDMLPPTTHASVRNTYDNVCAVTTGDSIASGVLLESGYILTAGHVADNNGNGMLDEDEKLLTVTFNQIDLEVQAEVLAVGSLWANLDIAILKPEQEIPLRGVRLMSDEEYWSLTVGTPVSAIGMTNGVSPANITDGRITILDPDRTMHWSSAPIWFGNSGGGMFAGEELAGITVAVGASDMAISLPIFHVDPEKRLIRHVGAVVVPLRIPVTSQSLYTPAPAIREFLLSNDLAVALELAPFVWPYQEYYGACTFNVFLIVGLGLVCYRWKCKN